MRDFWPPPALAPFVERFWFQDASEPAPHRILPDGCLDIIFSPDSAIVVGTMTRPLLIPPGPRASMLGVRFRPGMATAFLQVPAVALTDDRAPLDAIWPDGAEVADYVGSVVGSEEAVVRLAKVLAQRLPRTAAVPSDLRAAVGEILISGGRVDVARLAASLGVSRQHLARRFAAHVGVSPKTLCRVVRLWEVLRAVGPARSNWAALAAELGYYDQSHLVSEFRTLTGLTPARWATSRRAGSKTPSARLAVRLS